MTLRAQLGRPPLFHTVFWHGKDGPSKTGYLSNDPNVIGDQLSAMQAIGGDGAGVIALTYGPTVSPFIHGAVMECCRQCAERRMPFALCFDPWTVKGASDPTAAMIATLKHSDTQWMLNSRAYLSGCPVLDFNTTATAATVLAAVPGISYWQLGVDYSWIYLPDPLTPLVAANSRLSMKLPAIALQFDDGTGADRNKSVWDQTSPVRLASARAGGLWWDMAALIPRQAKYVQVVTWNDVDEGTAVEPFASALWGRIGG